MSRRATLTLAIILLAAAPASAQEWLQTAGERLAWSAGGTWARLSGSGSLTAYQSDRPPPGLVAFDGATFVAPRFDLALDAGAGPGFRLHLRATADRGFDPGRRPDGHLRLDEYFLQVQGAGRWRVRAGKFATAFGGWGQRHRAEDNPLISAPLLYGDMLTITDAVVPPNPGAQAGRRNVPDNKATWVPLIWGPSYATGIAVAFTGRYLSATAEIKNAALSSPPAVWDADRRGIDEAPTITARLRWFPGPRWALGLSGSQGPYLQDRANGSVPAGRHAEDFDQTTLGLDLRYAHRDLEIWAELARGRFEVPNVGSLALYGAFVEARYKLTPRLDLAGRWNRSWFEPIPGDGRHWNRHLWRLDLGFGYRVTTHITTKLELSRLGAAGRAVNGRHLATLQMVFWF